MTSLRCLLAVLVATAVAASMAGSARAGVRRVATLGPRTGQLDLGLVAVSGSTVVATGTAVDVFREPAGGWASAAQPSAVLSDPAITGLDSGPNGISISGDAIVAGFGGGLSSPAHEDVFAEPSGGWSGTVTPSAQLAPGSARPFVTGAVIDGRAVAAYASAQSTNVNLEAPGTVVDIYRRPVAGWSGPVPPDARLRIPRGSPALSQLAFTGSAVFVPTLGATYVFQRPASGWTGTLRPSATLDATGQVSAAAGRVLVGHAMFSRPRKGWSGTIEPLARLMPRLHATADDPEPETAQVLTARMALYAETRIGSGEGCGSPTIGCPTTLYASTRPTGGWRGVQRATPVLRMRIGEMPAIAAAGRDLFLARAGVVTIDKLSGTYGAPGAPRPRAATS